MRVLVTGSEGFVAGYLIERLKESDHEVSGFDIANNINQDMRQYDSIRAMLDKVQPDWIFHLAACAYVPESTTDARRSFNVNTLGTINLMEALRQSGADPRVLVAGTVEEYGYQGHEGVVDESTNARPQTLYGISKLAASLSALNYGQQYGIPTVVTRAVNHTGPGHNRIYAVPAFARRVALAEKYGDVVTHGNLSATRYYLDVRDVVDAYMLAIKLEPGLYNVTSDAPVVMEHVLDTLCGVGKTEIVRLPTETLYRTLNSNVPVISDGKFRKATNWRPMIDLSDTLQDTLNFWRRHV